MIKFMQKLIAFSWGMACILLLFSQSQPAYALETSIQKKILDNGLTLIIEKDDSSHIAVIQIFIKGGQRAEPSGKKGLAYLTTRLALEIPDEGKAMTIMSQATSLSAGVNNDFSNMTIICLSAYLEDTVDLVSKIMREPLFSGIRIDWIKDFMIRQAKMEGDRLLMAAHQKSQEVFFSKTPYGGSVYGSEETLKAIKKEDIKLFHETHFTGHNMLVTVSSDLDKGTVSSLMEKHFQEFPSGKSLDFPPFNIDYPEQDFFPVEKNIKQSIVSKNFLLSPPSSRTYILSLILENLLGKGIHSKLWPLRAQEKLAYSVDARLTYAEQGGILETYLETEAKNADRALVSLSHVLNDLYTKGITEDEFQVTKTFSRALFLINNEAKESRAYTRGFFEMIGLGSEFFNQLLSEIEPVTLDEFNAYLKEVLNPEKGVTVVIGPAASSQ